MAMLNESDFQSPFSDDDYTPPRPVDELCEETPVEGGHHIKSLVSDRCMFCKREIES